jgi:glycosyltransferase involved in cell wall biosynthesis
MNPMKKLSIVIPVYNEKDTLGEVIRRVVAVDVGMEKEIVLVDDFSTDGTRGLYDGIIAQWPDIPIRLYLHDINCGKGAALRTGFAHATGDIVLVQDADLEYHPNDYPRLLQPIREGLADVVYGSRFAGGEAHRVLLFWHMVGNKMLTLISDAFTNLNLTDMETCYKVFRAETLKSLKLKSDRFTIEPEITAKLARKHWRIYEVGISYAGREYDEGKKITWRDALPALAAIIRYRFWD